MRYLALATDYDGRLAHDGKVRPATVAMLKSLISSGRRLLLVTGRELPDLLQIFRKLIYSNGWSLRMADGFTVCQRRQKAP